MSTPILDYQNSLFIKFQNGWENYIAIAPSSTEKSLAWLLEFDWAALENEIDKMEIVREW